MATGERARGRYRDRYPMTAILRFLALVGLLIGLWAPAVQAHAVLQSASPADGSVLATAPDALRLQFNEAVRPLSIQLIGPDGVPQDLTAQVPGAAELAIPLAGAGRGTHLLSWRVVSDDGHPISGALVFSVGEVTGATPAPPEAAGLLRPAIWAARLAMVAGLVLGVGGAWALTWIPAPAARRPVVWAAGLGLIAAPAYLGLHGLDALGLGFAAWTTLAPWRAAAQTSFGPAILLAMGAAALALAAGRWPRLAHAAALLLALTFAASGHAGAAMPRWLTRPMVFAHLAAVLVWIGALIPLTLSLKTGAVGLWRFSRWVPVAVLVMLLSGLVLSFIQLGPEPRFWGSAYGLILAAKLGLLALLFGLAGWNRWHLTQPALRGEVRAVGQLRRMIWAELALALVILGLTAGWRFTPPSRALATLTQSSPAPIYAHLHEDAVMAMLTLDPGQAGQTRATIQLTDAEMQPIQPLGVTLHLSRPAQGIERLTRVAEPDPQQGGGWQVSDLTLPLPGLWQVELEIRLTRFQLIRLKGEIALR